MFFKDQYKESFEIWEKYGGDIEIHRFYMNLIDHLRERKGSLSEVAKILDVSVFSVKNWSCGRKLPNNKNALLIIKAIEKEFCNGNSNC